MALRTNSKKARENVRTYILNHIDLGSYNIVINTKDFAQAAHGIIDIFREEKSGYLTNYNDFPIFLDWTQGLPTALDCCYWYNRSAVDDLGAILEETEAEKAKYTEEEAGLLLTKLIYRELINA